MSELIDALDDLEYHGSKSERAKFKVFKRRIVANAIALQEYVHEKLIELKRHHLKTLKHSVLVAYDAAYIGREFGIRGKDLEVLELAAFLHDLGKIDVHQAILDSTAEEQLAAWKKKFPRIAAPDFNTLRTRITLAELIDVKGDRCPPGTKAKFVRDCKQWIAQHGLLYFLDQPYYEYFKHHQFATEKLLRALEENFEPTKRMTLTDLQNLIAFAASHHPEYFATENERAQLPMEGRIIEVADKFNAIIQSEGPRAYVEKNSKIRALEIIFSQLEHEVGVFQSDKKKMIGILAKKYLSAEIKKGLVPQAAELERKLNRAIDYGQTHDPIMLPRAKKIVRQVLAPLKSILADIAATFVMIKEFPLESSVARDLKGKLRKWKSLFENALELALQDEPVFAK